MGLWLGVGSGDGVVALSGTVSAVGPAGCQAGKGVPSPAQSGTGRKGKGWGQEGQSGARGGHARRGERPAPPGQVVPFSLPVGWDLGPGGTHNAPLNLAQNKQRSATGENSQPVFQADREMVEPFSSGPIPAGRHSSINPLSLGGSGELVPGLLLASLVMGLLPFGLCIAEQ